MEMGYSRLLISEFVLPDTGAALLPASLDFLMMTLMGGIERTESQWRSLLDSVGLEIVKIWILFSGVEASHRNKIERLKHSQIAGLKRPRRDVEANLGSWSMMQLLRRFDFSLIDPTNPWRSVNVGLFLQSEMWVRVARRENKAEFETLRREEWGTVVLSGKGCLDSGS